MPHVPGEERRGTAPDSAAGNQGVVDPASPDAEVRPLIQRVPNLVSSELDRLNAVEIGVNQCRGILRRHSPLRNASQHGVHLDQRVRRHHQFCSPDATPVDLAARRLMVVMPRTVRGDQDIGVTAESVHESSSVSV